MWEPPEEENLKEKEQEVWSPGIRHGGICGRGAGAQRKRTREREGCSQKTRQLPEVREAGGSKDWIYILSLPLPHHVILFLNLECAFESPNTKCPWKCF